jgi:hypothetical protein
MPHYATRAVRQKAVDWLFEALLRSKSPALLATRSQEFSFADAQASYSVALLKPDPQKALDQIEHSWIQQQANYHDRNSRVMQRIARAAEHLAKLFNSVVIVIVLLDLLLLLITTGHWLDECIVEGIHHIAPWLVVLTAVLPAAVASLNGIRFQSECSRLADRSAMMRKLLEGSEPRNPGDPRDPRGSKLGDAQALRQRITDYAGKLDDPASWTPEVLRLAESTAEVFAREVAEWSVLYAKEVPEP